MGMSLELIRTARTAAKQIRALLHLALKLSESSQAR